ncbi:hypothetical protein KP79_PYT22808 [Mizuhopecten yessoensis]|uniref:Uncharacterized protein n=1 Tax=Mizuhopecten yessoensis TaxID=6573 RepID=A0A210Q6M0_MIZYE|nr:hypothetical protein KP79_PYT22808 [Mizuhopecten yessoensis]
MIRCFREYSGTMNRSIHMRLRLPKFLCWQKNRKKGIVGSISRQRELPPQLSGASIKYGVIIPKYRARKKQENEHLRYVPCELCLGTYLSTDLKKHQKAYTVFNGKMLLQTTGSDKNLYDNILVKMRDDSIKHAAQTDQLILSLGTRLYDKKWATCPSAPVYYTKV